MNLILSASWLTAGTMAVVVICALIALDSQSTLIFLALAAFPPLVALVNHPRWLLGLTIAISASGLRHPSFPENLTWFYVLIALFVILSVLHRLIGSPRHIHRSAVRVCILGLSAIVIMTAAVRGVGLRFLGSTQWGGGVYVILILSALLFLNVDMVVLSPRLWRRSLIAMCLLAFLPALAQVVYLASGGRIVGHYAYIQTRGFIAEALLAMQSGTGSMRMNTYMGALLTMFPLIAFTEPFRGKRAPLSAGLILVSLILLGLSGYRSGLLQAGILLIAWTLLGKKKISLPRTLTLGVALLAALMTAGLAAPHLPWAVQRSLSFLPMVNVSPDARADALQTLQWRWEVWQRALPEVPKYLWIGKGLTYDPLELQALRWLGWNAQVIKTPLIVHAYHNSYLSLLLGFGVPGLLLGLCLVFAAGFRYYHIMRSEEWLDPDLRRMFRACLAYLLSLIVQFLLIWGDIATSFPMFMLYGAILEGMLISNRAMKRQAAISPAETVIPL